MNTLQENLAIYDQKKLSVRVIPKNEHTFQGLRLRSALRALEPVHGSVLDIGCGLGALARSIKAYRPDLKLFGCDASESSLVQARAAGDVEYAFCTLPQLPYAAEQFDAIIASDIFEHVDDLAGSLAATARILKPNGIFWCFFPCERSLFSVYHIRRWYRIKQSLTGHVQKLSFREAKKIFGEHFDILYAEYSYHPLGQMRDLLRYVSLARGNNPDASIFLRRLQNIATIESRVFFWLPLGALGLTLIMKKRHEQN